MERKKILFLIHTLGAGGAEKALVNLVNNMNYKKYDITVMTVINTGKFRNDLNQNIQYKTMFNIPILNNKEETKNVSGSLLNKTSKKVNIISKIYQLFWKMFPAKLIYTIFIKEKYDVEVSFLEGICAKIISNSTNKKSKKIAWVHVDLLNENKSEKFFKNIREEKKCYNKFNSIVAVSNIVKESVIKKYNIDFDKVLVKYNPIDINEITNKANDNINMEISKKIKLISIGRLTSQKGYDCLLRIAKKLKDDKIDYELWIIGVGPEEDNLKKYIHENYLSNYVKLLGFKENPYKYLKIADLFVCSSRAEGFSTAVSEAIILGVPVITTDCSGMRELLGDNNEYGIVTKNDEKSLYEGLKSLLLNNKKYQHYLKKIKLRKNMFDINRAVNEIEEMFGGISEKNYY
jgi:glycosyltransferase involved in cell wall biosynthesis